MARKYEHTVTLTGTGSQWTDAAFPKRSGHSGSVVDVKVQERTGGGATAMDLYVVKSDVAISATPNRTLCPYVYTTITLTASATALSLSDPVEAGAVLTEDDYRIAGNVTGSGAWTIDVTIGYERDF
jgi:bacillopeptidase F (M6 metalloprotease family)